MEWFHSPDISLPVLRRRAGEALLDLLAFWGPVAINPMRSVYRGLSGGDERVSESAYCNAVRRLKKKGLVATRSLNGRTPKLVLTPRAHDTRPEELKPESRWNAKWNGRWYLLTYDIPETEKRYRGVLRAFLRQQRLGYLQNSVWISPFDYRPAFDDLCRAAALGDFAYLFEARSVLGLAPQAIVNASWDFDRLHKLQHWYVAQVEALLLRIRRETLSDPALESIAREDGACYLSVMHDDPLLPKALCPPDYAGPLALDAHRRLQRAVAARRFGE